MRQLKSLNKILVSLSEKDNEYAKNLVIPTTVIDI